MSDGRGLSNDFRLGVEASSEGPRMPLSVTSWSMPGAWMDEPTESRVRRRPRLYAVEEGVIWSWASMAFLTARRDQP